MISLAELNPHKYPTTLEIDKNLNTLLFRLNRIREAWGKPMTITSGLRDMIQQKALIAQGKSNALKSKHLSGQAADIYDPNRELQAWVMENLSLIEEIGFWMESFNITTNWVHFQTVPPRSGKRIFNP